MTRFDRRTYLKGAIAGGVALVGSTSVALGSNEDGGGAVADYSHPEIDPRDRGCPAGTSSLAKYEVRGGEFALDEGEDVVAFSDIEYKDENQRNEVVSFSWSADEIVAVVAVQFGPNIRLQQGGFRGANVDVREWSAEDPVRAIGNVEFCKPRGGRAALCELDGDRPGPDAFDTKLRLEGSPVEEEEYRENVLRIHSDGVETRDYAHSMVSLRSRISADLRLRDLEAVTYDYFAGQANTPDAHGAIFVSLLTPDETSTKDEGVLAVNTVAPDATGTFQEVDVLDRMRNEEWNIVDGIEFQHGELLNSGAFENLAATLRDTPRERRPLLSGTFDDALVAGIGVGAAITRRRTAIDRYYDALNVEWTKDEHQGSELFDFPALLSVTVENIEERGDNFELTLSFDHVPEGVTFGDVDRDSVKLNNYHSFATPAEIGVGARTVQPRDDRLETRFSLRAVEELLTGDGVFIVSGDFDVPSGTSFFGVDERAR